jgi:dynein light chain LC8-type
MFLFGSLMLIDVVLQEFDRSYGPGWQCIVGTDFGSFVTHHSGCFIYFGIGNLSILLFNGGAPQVDTPEQQGRLTALKAAVEA